MDNPKESVLKYLNTGLRFDKRKLDEYRKITVETGVVETAEGSARVRLGETEVIVGIKLDAGKPYPDTPNEGVLMLGAELLPMSNPIFESGPPSIWAIEISRIIDRGFRESKAIDTKKLVIKEGEKVWMINVDICSINDAGNLLDASAIAVLAALKDTKFPVFENDKIDYKQKTEKKLPIKNSPYIVTVYKAGDKLFVDPLTSEEGAYDARLSVAAMEDNTICALQKGGESALTEADLDAMISLALVKINELREIVGI